MKFFVVVLIAAFCLASASFLERQKIIDAVNKANNGWVASHNKFSGWEAEDIKGLLGAVLPPKAGNRARKDSSLPDSFDARQKWNNCIHPIRDQQQCGSCWAFSAAEALSDRVCIGNGVDVILSPQDLVSCDTENMGCDGGYLPATWDYMVATGLVTDTCFPYVSGTGTAPACPGACVDSEDWNKKYKAASYSNIPASQMQQELYQNGPMQVAFDVYEDFMSYSGGVYRHLTGQYLGGHAVKVIGWGNQNGDDYWLIANSWGPDWGLSGYFMILRGTDECSIEDNAYAGPAAQ